MEMQRRLKSAIYSLIGEIVTFRESADKAAEKSEAADRKLARLTTG